MSKGSERVGSGCAITGAGVVRVGRGSVKIEAPVYICESASVVGKKESEGPLGDLFDRVEEDDLVGGKTWEEAESNLQKKAVEILLDKAGLSAEDVDVMYAGDLLAQSMASNFGLGSFGIPFYGLYGACSTCGESLGLGSLALLSGLAERVVCVTSSHFASAEKEFRYPLEYGNQRPLSASWTVTGSGAFLLSAKQDGIKSQPRARIAGLTVGQMIDSTFKDSMNMGACMAPAVASTLERHFQDFNVEPEEYDRIITGDLGKVGQRILFDLMEEKGYDISAQHMDCGIEIFDGATQDTHAGGSGCGCCAVTMSAYILRQVESGLWKKVLFIPTGALLSKVSFNEGNTVPGIAQAVVIEQA